MKNLGWMKTLLALFGSALDYLKDSDKPTHKKIVRVGMAVLVLASGALGVYESCSEPARPTKQIEQKANK